MDNLKLNENFQELNVDESVDIDGGNRLVSLFGGAVGGLTRNLLSNVISVTLPDLGERRECTSVIDCLANSVSTFNNVGNWIRSFRQ